MGFQHVRTLTETGSHIVNNMFKQWPEVLVPAPGTDWAKGLKAFLPTGRIGCAVSNDGLKWSRCKGPLEAPVVFRVWIIVCLFSEMDDLTCF